MPDTLSSLIAKLGDCPKTKRLLKYDTYDVAYGELADAALLELAGKASQWKQLRDGWVRVCKQHDELSADAAQDLERWAESLLKRAEAAEADLALCFHDKDAAEQRLMQAEARVTALDIQLRDADHENIGLKAEVAEQKELATFWHETADLAQTDSEQAEAHLARLRHYLQAIVDMGHNDDCLFCARKDHNAQEWAAREEAGDE